MKAIISIPKEFLEHYHKDKFEDSLQRVLADLDNARVCLGYSVAGKYESEVIEMLRIALKESEVM